jgi:hypothetical protein
MLNLELNFTSNRNQIDGERIDVQISARHTSRTGLKKEYFGTKLPYFFKAIALKLERFDAELNSASKKTN